MKFRRNMSLSVETIKFLEELSKELFGYINLSATVDYVVTQFKKNREES